MTTKDKTSTDGLADFRPTMRFRLTFMNIEVLTLMVALDVTTSSVALPRIAGGFTVLAAKRSGQEGHSRSLPPPYNQNTPPFQPSSAGNRLSCLRSRSFLAGTLIGGLAHNFTLLLLSRSLQGAGGGGNIALTEIVVTNLVPHRLRGQWFGILHWTSLPR